MLIKTGSNITNNTTGSLPELPEKTTIVLTQHIQDQYSCFRV